MAKKNDDCEKSFNVRLYMRKGKVTALGFVHTARVKRDAIVWGDAAPTDVDRILKALGLKRA